jgi:hypothetical protein
VEDIPHRITVAQCSTLAARQQPSSRIHEERLLIAGSDGRRLPAAALPGAPRAPG